jgi:DNA excision repair protein ERCC-5
VRLGLVDGIVTDDSDCFLFGGTRVYKNMFNQAKLVECYLSSDLEKVGWSREKLVQAAHLLGSDYTEGLPGIGPVSAAEILGEFQTLDEFKEWWSGVQMNAIPKGEDWGKPVRKKLRKQSMKLFLPPTFPDTRVDIAYTHPDVDSDPEQFQWGVPDLDALRSFLMATIGWSQERTDEVLVPVIRDMNRRMDEGTQSNITAFFDGGVGIGAAGAAKGNSRSETFAPRKRAAESSKRMGSALSRMAEKARLRRDGIATATGDSVEQGRGELTSRSTKKDSKKGSKRKTPDPSEDDETSDFEGPRKRAKKRGSGAKPARDRKKKSRALL